MKDKEKKLDLGKPQLSISDDEPSSPAPNFTALVSASGDKAENVFSFDTDEVIPVTEIPPPPDGGWGWVIVFASFMCNMVLDGITYTFGVLLGPMANHFNASQSATSWAGSLCVGLYLISGPLVGGMVNKFGCRPTCILGCFVAAAGFALSVLSPNIPVLMLTYGVIGGIGLGMIFLPSIVMVGYYFEKKRALATGIAVCGSGVGCFVFAPLSSYLEGQVGWQGANLIFAAMCLGCTIFGALMKPLTLTARIDSDAGDGDEDKTNNFSVQLPDGGRVIPEEHPPHFAHHHRDSDGMGFAPSMNIPHLPTIAETSVTAAGQQQDEYLHVKNIFPDPEVAAKQEDEKDSGSQPLLEDPETSMKGTPQHIFQVKPIRPRTKSGSHGTSHGNSGKESMARNQSAPHFIQLDTQNFPRNSSTPGFGRFGRPSFGGGQQFGSTNSSRDQVAFGLGSNGHMGSHTTLELRPGSRRESMKTNRPIVRPMYRKDVFYGGSMAHLALQTENSLSNADMIANRRSSARLGAQSPHPTSANFHRNGSGTGTIHDVPSTAQFSTRESIISIPRFYVSRNSSFAGLSLPRDSIVAGHLTIPGQHHDSLVKDEILEKDGSARPLLSVLEEMLSLSLLRDPKVVLIALSNFLSMLGFYVPFIYLPNMAKNRGVEETDASFLLSIIGIANTLGRVLAGMLADRPWVNCLLLNNIAILMSGIMTIVFPFCINYTSYAITAAIYGLFVATYVSVTSVILVDLLGLDKLTNAFGLVVLFRGIACMVGTPVAGSIYDHFQNYDIPFILAGMFLIIAALVSFAIHIVLRWQNRQEANQKPQ